VDVALASAAFGAEQQAAQGLPGVRFLDMNDQICRGGRCPALDDGVLIYRDDNHLTGTFAGKLALVLDSRLPPIVAAAVSGVPARY
jgi:hypothetical protein